MIFVKLVDCEFVNEYLYMKCPDFATSRAPTSIIMADVCDHPAEGT